MSTNNKEYLCSCNQCDNVFIDTNPQSGAKQYLVDNSALDILDDHRCPICKVDDYLTDKVDVSKILQAEVFNNISIAEGRLSLDTDITNGFKWLTEETDQAFKNYITNKNSNDESNIN